MIVVSDTTLLISLLKIDRINLLEKLFGQVLMVYNVLVDILVGDITKCYLIS